MLVVRNDGVPPAIRSRPAELDGMRLDTSFSFSFPVRGASHRGAVGRAAAVGGKLKANLPVRFLCAEVYHGVGGGAAEILSMHKPKPKHL